MLDGFRWDYVERLSEQQVPVFKKFLETGVQAEYVQPIFPSVSFPSWTTISTGQRAENHGIVGNYMYNRETGKEFSLSRINLPGDESNDPSWWDQHIPLWTSATKEGVRTSIYLWSNCDVPFDGGVLPEKCRPYDNFECLRLDLFGQNLRSASADLRDGFDLAMVYYGNVDEVGHLRGPDSQALEEEIINVDYWIGDFLAALERDGLRNGTDVVIVSDHGMTDTRGRTSTRITNFIDGDLIERACDLGPHMQVALKDPSTVDQAASDLSAWEGVDVFRKEDIPDHFGLRNNDLVLDLLLVSLGDQIINQDFEYSDAFLPFPVPSGEDPKLEKDKGNHDTASSSESPNVCPTKKEKEGCKKSKFKSRPPPASSVIQNDTRTPPQLMHGFHGFDDTSPKRHSYDPGSFPDMRGIFFANGPSFKSGFVNPWIKLVDEYQIFLKLLGIEGEDHEGNFDRVQDMFA